MPPPLPILAPVSGQWQAGGLRSRLLGYFTLLGTKPYTCHELLDVILWGGPELPLDECVMSSPVMTSEILQGEPQRPHPGLSGLRPYSPSRIHTGPVQL